MNTITYYEVATLAMLTMVYWDFEEKVFTPESTEGTQIASLTSAKRVKGSTPGEFDEYFILETQVTFDENGSIVDYSYNQLV